MKPYPPINPALIQLLKERYPVLSADPTIPHADLLFRGGQGSVIEFLQYVLEEQQNQNSPTDMSGLRLVPADPKDA